MMDVKANIPEFNTPFIGQDGRVNYIWWQFLLKLFARTGGTSGNDGDASLELIRSLEGSSSAMVAFQAISGDSPGADAQIGRMPRPAVLVPDQMAYQHGIHDAGDLHAVVTAAKNGFMASADKSKLDGFPNITPVALTADATIVNSTADGNILQLTAPASSLAVGSTIGGRLYALVSSAAATGTLSVWLKIGATKVITQTFMMPALGQTNTGMSYYFTASVRTTGASGTIQLSALMTSNGNALNAGPVVSTASATINTTISNTFTLGWNWSVANAANSATAKNAVLSQEKL
ncbi:TPA: hypothetical protein P7236_006383 [Pseudomonas aeruginosa]|nr:hypothetical protein [Pseudomonas aeruginosa]EJC9817166.1 hypothetical protein [Pseudomonas aeruginosa]EKW3263910.1 hypothetical protein [Pseudomonas aeruginosa]ELB4562724.1 hypothetical protein [Pseudomonas aeruginosa]ELB5378597.1 hypothetical protein [Pseudomonas aeruginosa]ELB5398115.1 hypothetical protein [Pseudomonas aeruginosa]